MGRWACRHVFTSRARGVWHDRGMRVVPLIAIAVLASCVPKSDLAVQPWRAEARPTHGVVRVMPIVALQRDQEVQLDSFLGVGLPWVREWLRSRRSTEIDEVPAALGIALPGAVNGVLGSRWDGQFLKGHGAPGARARIRGALKGRGDLDAALGMGVAGVEGDAALFTWITSLDSRPLNAEGFPGEIISTASGPVVLDFMEAPFLLEAHVGMALVARDGEVVMRYDDHISTVLSARRDSDTAAGDIAEVLASEVAKLWAVDPRLEGGVPSDPLAQLLD